MSLDDDDLLSNYVRDRDADSFAVLVERYQSVVYSTSLRKLGNSADAADVSQEVFLSLAKNAGRITSGNLGGWLYRCALNAANSKLRTERSRSAREKARAVPDHRTDTSAEWRQIEEVLDACVAELPEESRELIIQRFFANRSQNELAEAFGVGQATISRRLKKAVEQLRRRMASRGVGLTAAAIAVAIEEHACASAAPAGLSAGLTKIGVAGVGGESAKASPLSLLASSWPAVSAAAAILVVPAALLIPRFIETANRPTTAVASLGGPLAATLIAELKRLDYTKTISWSAVSMNDHGQVAMFLDRPEELAGVYLLGRGRPQRLRQLPRHTRRSLTIGPGAFVAVNYDGRVGVLDSETIRPLTQSSDVNIPPSLNSKGWVAFVETTPVSRIRVATAESVRTLHEAGDRFLHFGRACINEEGDVAFQAETSSGASGLFVSRQGSLSVVAEEGDAFTQFRPGFDFNNQGQLALIAQHADGTEALCVGDETGLTPVARTGDYFASILNVSLNDVGMVAFTARRPAAPTGLPIAGLYLWDGERVVEVLPRGQTIRNRRLEGVLLWRDSLNNAGQLTVLADFGPGELSAIQRLEVNGLQLAE